MSSEILWAPQIELVTANPNWALAGVLPALPIWKYPLLLFWNLALSLLAIRKYMYSVPLKSRLLLPAVRILFELPSLVCDPKNLKAPPVSKMCVLAALESCILISPWVAFFITICWLFAVFAIVKLPVLLLILPAAPEWFIFISSPVPNLIEAWSANFNCA